ITAAFAIVGVVAAQVGGVDEQRVGARHAAVGILGEDARRVGAHAVRLDAGDDLLALDLLLPQDARLRALALRARRRDVDRGDPGAVALRLIVAFGPGADGRVRVGVGDRAAAARPL